MSNRGQVLYQKFVERTRKIALLESTSSLLDWDQETMMPDEAMGVRAEQQGLISGIIHKERTSKAFAKMLKELIDLSTGEIVHADLTAAQIASLKCYRTDYLKEAKLPHAFVKKFAELTSEATHVWAKARRHNAFNDFAPYLTKIVDMNRKKAEYLGYHQHPYDALLDLYEPEMTAETLKPIFLRLRLELNKLLKEISAKPVPESKFLSAYFPESKQMDFGMKLLSHLGFKPANSRLDLAAHPFCSALYVNDIRMTTRIHPEYLLSNIFSVLHEAGHGLYALGRSASNWGTPLGASCSLGIDESQSRFWETMVGKSLPFWQYFFPLLQQQFSNELSSIDLDTFYRAINGVKPGFIRVEADEVCYCLHIIVRFELELALIEGTLKVKDLPEAWNSKMVEYLGILPQHDAQGCLQDIHWSMGGFGYFPTYALGNIYAAQFFKKFKQLNPSWEKELASGNLALFREYFKEIIYKYGRQYSPQELLHNATQEMLSEAPYIEYLSSKFNALYK